MTSNSFLSIVFQINTLFNVNSTDKSNSSSYSKVFSNAGVKLANLFHFFFDFYSANTQNINVTTLKIKVIV